MVFLLRNNQKPILFFILLLAVFNVTTYGQKESSNWYFGIEAGLSFNSGSPVYLSDSNMGTHEGSATISDENGNLLFYTDGVTIWDRQHRVMLNGTGLLGNKSSTMSALIVPKPGSLHHYYVFTIDEPGKSVDSSDDGHINGVNYSEVDMTRNGGYGEVVSINSHLVTYNTSDANERYFKSSEKITAVTHDNETSIWVITHFTDSFYAFLIDETGVSTQPVTSRVSTRVDPRVTSDSINVTALGYLKVSPNGKKIAMAHSSTALGSPRSGTKNSGKIFLYDFDNTTGRVSNEKLVRDGNYPYGIEFSPNSKLLYATVGNYDTSDTFEAGYLFQYDLNASPVSSSEVLIRKSNMFAGALQLAIDGKMYRAGYKPLSNSKDLSVIEKPNIRGTACNYREGVVSLGRGESRLGLPPFVQSIFKYRFSYTYSCSGSGFNVNFSVLPNPAEEDPDYVIEWDFGDGSMGSNSFTHFYNTVGDYYVSMKLTINGETQVFNKTITLEAEPVLDLIYELIACDASDNNNSDGLTYFNLFNLNGKETMFSTEHVQVYFYTSQTDAEDDINNEHAINSIFRNTVRDQIVFAKVYANHSNCYEITAVKLKTSNPIAVGQYTLESCGLENPSQASFNLQDFKTEIRLTKGFSNDVNLTYYESYDDAQNGNNPVSNVINYVSPNTTLFVKAESNNVCYAIGEVRLKVNPFPVLQDKVYEVCMGAFPITINSGVATSGNFIFDWSLSGVQLLQHTNNVSVNAPGIYAVTITDADLGCDKTIMVEVKTYPMPEIKKIDISDDYSITVHLNNNSIHDFEFAVDDLYRFQDGNSFTNLSPGKHMLYVRDRFYCNQIQETFFVFGFPKFLTPNNDGIHDFWKVEGAQALGLTKPVYVYIFDRYGKLLKVLNVLSEEVWDGTVAGNYLISDDYWYRLDLPNGKSYKGHFTLKN